MNKAQFILGIALASSAAYASVAMAEEGLDLAKKSGCLACHSVVGKVVGPAWQDVANKYKGAKEITATLTDGTVAKGAPKDVLIQKIHKGGKGNWTAVTGGVPMPPYSPRVADADIEKLTDFVLGLAK
jgi:cytochrome c